MRNARFLPLLAALLALSALLLSCRLETPWLGSPAAGEVSLPADKVLDVSRSTGGTFQFETLLPVQLNLTVDLYRQPTAAGALEKLSAAGELIVVTLENSHGEPLYSGRVPSGGTLSATLALPAAPEDMVLGLEAPGFESRQVTLKSMVQYEEINRVMGLLASGTAAKAEAMPDLDSDGIPDLYDAYPSDPDAAFSARNPASGWLTVAYEDLYLIKNAGDADYNDFAARYFVEEAYAGSEQTDLLARLTGQAVAAAKISGYNHRFGIVFDFPGAAAELTVHGFDFWGLPRTTTASVRDKAVVWLFDSTKNAVGKTADFTLEFPEPIDRGVLSIAPYDPFLYVINTGKDVHLIGRDPLPTSNNPPGSDFQDDAGFPWALLVPEEWQHPAETQYIGKAYPLFDAWRTSFGQSASNWYLYPASAYPSSGNNTPYPVTGPTTSPLFAAGAAATFQLDTTAPLGLPDDPDGDQVFFRNSSPPAALEGKVSLDEKSGLVSFSSEVEAGEYLMYFWSEDEHGASTIASPYKVRFRFEAKAINQVPSITLVTLTGGTAIGDTLAAAYGFSDPDGDAEGATTFQWYRFDTSTDVSGGTAISGAVSYSYTTVDLTGNSDSNKWLRIQVTPVDDQGAAGTPVLSDPVRINRRIVIDTFSPTGTTINDTYLRLIDASGAELAANDDGSPQGWYYSRIDVAKGLPTGIYYIEVSKDSLVGGIYYAIRVLDFNPLAYFPLLSLQLEATDSDDSVDAGGLPTTPTAIDFAQPLSRALNPEETDHDWFMLELK